MSAATSFPWPKPSGASSVRWTGSAFEVDGAEKRVLTFAVGESGWTDDLTELHEDSGSGDHPIDVASRARAVEAIRGTAAEGGTILEVGCSAGHTLRDLRRAFPDALVIGADYVPGPLEDLGRSMSGVPLLQLDLTRCPLPDRSVDAVVALNVLEHIEDDRAAVREIFRVLRPGGVAAIEVPAAPSLYDVYDQVLMHHRRYTRRGIVRLFEEAGFRVSGTSHLGFFVFPAFALVKLKNKRHMKRPEAERRAMVAASIQSTSKSAVLDALLGLERAAGKFVRYPVGIRCVLTASKPTDSRP